jgi:hypothetical protein
MNLDALKPLGPKSDKFPDLLLTTPIHGRADYVRFVLPFRFHSSVGTITAHAGFDSDGASVPGAVRPIINPHGNLRWASAPHDVAYYYGACSAEPDAKPLTKGQADLAILEALEECGSSWLVRQTVYRTLQTCGWVAWNKCRRAREAELRGEPYVPIKPVRTPFSKRK